MRGVFMLLSFVNGMNLRPSWRSMACLMVSLDRLTLAIACNFDDVLMVIIVYT